jgi:uncharacterized protein
MVKILKKKFVDGVVLTRYSFHLAKKIYDSGFIPDYILMIARGGFPISIAIHEYFRYKNIEIEHGAVRAVSYKNIGQRKIETQIVGMDNLKIQPQAKILIIDDIFDTGRTIAKVLSLLPKNTKKKIAVIHYKPSNNKTTIIPDYYIKTTKDWLIYPHEIDGLSSKELRKKDAYLFKLLSK